MRLIALILCGVFAAPIFAADASLVEDYSIGEPTPGKLPDASLLARLRMGGSASHIQVESKSCEANKTSACHATKKTVSAKKSKKKRP